MSQVPMFSLDGLERDAFICDVYDGDTFKAIFPLEEKLYKWNCRIVGIDTPEIRTRNTTEKQLAIIARDYLREKILGKNVKLRCHKFDKYGRVLVTLNDQNNNDISDQILSNGYGKAYFGGKRVKNE